jgi:hypothetical protein
VISVDFEDRPLSALPKVLCGLLDYWRTLCGDRFAPTWKEFDMLEIPVTCIRMTMVKDVEENPRTYRYRFYGSEFTRLNRRDLTGDTTDDVAIPALASAVRQSLDEFVAQKKPRFYQLNFTHEYRRNAVQHLLRLPISNDGKSVTSVVSVVLDHLEKDAYHDLIDAEQAS